MDLVPYRNVFTVPTTSLRSMVIGTLNALRQIRRQRIDLAIDLEFFARFSAALTWLSGARWRVGMHAYHGEGPYRGDLFTHRVLYNPHIPRVRCFSLWWRRQRGLPQDCQHWTSSGTRMPEPGEMFLAAPEEKARVKGLLQQKTGAGEDAKFILLNPNASDLLPLRRWPPEHYTTLAKNFLSSCLKCMWCSPASKVKRLHLIGWSRRWIRRVVFHWRE